MKFKPKLKELVWVKFDVNKLVSTKITFSRIFLGRYAPKTFIFRIGVGGC